MRKFALALSVLAALRLGIIGFLGFDLIGSLFGSAPMGMSGFDRIICAIVGIAGIYSAYILLLVGDEVVTK